MNTHTTPAPATTPRLHPLVAIAAIAVTTFSLAGIAAMSGLLPTSQASAPTASPPIAVPPAVQAVAPAPTFAVPPSKAVEKPAIKRTVKAEATPSAPSEPAPQAATPLPPAIAPALAPAPCLSCGTIDNVREIAQPGEGSGLGAVIGGVVGGLLGNQVGKGTGNTVATVLGAAGGAYAGHQVEKSRRQVQRYEISVRMADGSLRTVTQDAMPIWRIGERVRLEEGRLVAAN